MRKMYLGRISAALLSSVLILSLCACGEQTPAVSDDPGKEVVQETPVSSAGEETKTETEQKEETPAEPVGEQVSEENKRPTAESEKLSAEVTPEVPKQEEAPAEEAKAETVTETPETEKTVTLPETEEVVYEEAPKVNVVTDITEVASEAELLGAMKADKVSSIKVTQEISLSESVSVSGAKTVSGAKITAAKEMTAMYTVAEGASLTIEQCIIDGAGKVGAIVESSGTVSIVNSELRGGTVRNGETGVMGLKYVNFYGCTSEESGAAVRNSGDLAIVGCTFTNNSSGKNGGAVFSAAKSVTKLESCTFHGNTSVKGGGALYLNGEVYLEGCTFTSNTAGTYGGAAYLNYTVTGIVESCTFTENTATANGGGGIYAAASGLKVSNVLVNNCRFEKNVSNQNGGGFSSFGVATVTNCKFIACYSAEHAGALNTALPGKMSVAGCEFRDNTAAQSGGAIRNAGDLIMEDCVLTNNVAEGDACGGGAYYCSALGRAQVRNCRFVGNKVTGKQSLGGAIYIYSTDNYAAGALFENCVIADSTSPYQGGGIYSMGWLEMRSCTVENCHVPDSGGGIWNIAGRLEMYDCLITRCSSGKNGGAVRNTGMYYYENCRFIDNSTTAAGAAAYLGQSAIGELVNCTFEGNKSRTNCGAVYVYGSSVSRGTHVIRNCTFRNNSCGMYGGAIRNQAYLTIYDSVFEENWADIRGGAVYCNAIGVLNMSGCTLRNNGAGTGGAMGFGGFVDGENDESVESEFAGMNSQVKIVNCEITDNYAENLKGGAVYSAGDVTFQNVNFARNEAGQDGGAIYNSGILKVEDCSFSDCHVTGEGLPADSYCHGGAIYQSNGVNGEAEIKNSVFEGCTSFQYGGAVAFNGSADGNRVEIIGSTFTGNKAGWRGGAISNTAITTLRNCKIYGNNSETYQGGGVFNYSTTWKGMLIPGRLSLVDCEIYNNESATDGGGIYNAKMSASPAGELTIDGCTITENVAGGFGGGVGSAGPLTIGSNNTIKNNTPDDGEVYISSTETAELTVKGSGNDIASVRLAAGKTIIASGSADLGNSKIYVDGNSSAGDALIEGSGSNMPTSSGDGRYEVDTDGTLIGATHTVSAPDGVSGAATATYGTDYTFTVPAGDYAVSVSVGGKKVPVTQSGTSCTVNGSFITGDVVISVTEVTTPSDIEATDEAYILDGAVTKAHGTLVDVLNAAEAGDTVYLVSDVVVDESIAFDKALTMTTVSGKSITVTLGANATLSVAADLMLQGKSDAELTFDGAAAARMNAGFTVQGSGSAIAFGEYVTVKGMNNQSVNAEDLTDGKGGAVCATDKASVIVSGASFLNNTSGKDGGAIFVSAASLTVTDGTFDGNTAIGGTADSTNGNFGGAIYVGEGATASLLGGSYTNNESARYGGVIAVKAASAILKGITTFENNRSGFGAVYTANSAASVSISDLTATNNTATNSAGFCYIGGGTVSIGDNVDLRGNDYNGTPESIFLYSGSMQLGGAMALDVVRIRTGCQFALTDVVTALSGADGAMTVKGTMADFVETALFAGGKALVQPSVPAIYLADNAYIFNTKYNGTVMIDLTPFKVGDVGFATLAEAIEYANTLSARATISMTQDVTATESVVYEIKENVDFSISSKTTISGPITFKGDPAVERSWPLFTVNKALTLENGVVIDGMNNIGTSGGGYGAAVRVNEGCTLVLTDVTVKNCTNARGGVYSNAGGATLTITNCLFEGNSATAGGALYGYGTANGACKATITDTAFVGNSSTGNGGAIFFNGSQRDQIIVNCTFTNNTAVTNGGAIYVTAAGKLTVEGGSFSGNTAGEAVNDVYSNEGTLALKGAIGITEIKLANAAVIALAADASAANTVGVTGAVGETVLTGENVSALYEKFAARGTDLYIDETGTIKSSNTNVIAKIGNEGYSTLAEAITAANSAAANGSVTVTLLKDAEITAAIDIGGTNKITIKLADNDTEGKTIDLGKSGRLNAAGDLDIVGTDTADLVIKSSASSRSIHTIVVRKDAVLSLENVTVQDIVTTIGTGGAFRVENGGKLVLRSSTVKNCKGDVGGIYMQKGSKAELIDSSFIGLTATSTSYGGVVHMNDATCVATISGCTFDGNSAATRGSALSVRGTLDLSGCVFKNNTGSAVAVVHVRTATSTVTVTNCTFNDNSAANNIRAIDGATVTVDGAALSADAEEVVIEEPIKTTVSVIESTAAPAEVEAPAVEEVPAVEGLPVVEELLVVEEIPAVEEIPVVEEIPDVEEIPVIKESPVVEETPVPEEAPAAETTV